MSKVLCADLKHQIFLYLCCATLEKFVITKLCVCVCFSDFSGSIGRPRQTGYYVPRSEYELVCSFQC